MRKKNKNKNPPRLLTEIVIITLSSLTYAFSIRTFTLPNGIAPGGVTGIATIVNHLTNMPVGLLYGLMNIPILIAGFVSLGKKMMLKTFLSIGVITVATDYLFTELPVYSGDRLLAAVFGGALLGGSLGFIFRSDATSGGSDVISRIIRKRLSHLSLGRIIITIDIAVVAASAIVFGGIDSALYAIISIAVYARMIDLILYGRLEGKVLLIFSDTYKEIAEKIMKSQDSGVTILKGQGGYSGTEKNVICCAVRKNQYAKIKNVVRDTDPNAFIVISDAGEVFGQGFSENKSD